MISSEVQRTLVKSPPELWAELSDPAALARHLGELGEIRITRAEPEKRVEWEAETASGTVLIKPSGWGTKVTLSVSRDLSLARTEPVIAGEEPEAIPEPEATSEAEPQASSEAEPEPTPEPEPIPAESEQAFAAPEPVNLERDARAETLEPTPEPRRGFFARLFGRRRPRDPATGTGIGDTAIENAASPSVEDSSSKEASIPSEPLPTISAIESLQARFQTAPSAAEVAEAPLPAAETSEETESAPSTDFPKADSSGSEVDGTGDVNPESAVDLAAELQAAEEAAVGEVTALLTAVLDRLGAAHHRPFSRS